MVRDEVLFEALKLLPKNLVSRVAGELAELPLPPGARGVVNRTFAQLAGIDLSEAERAPESYPSLNAFFTRHLKPGARPIDSRDPEVLVSPVDGRITQFGPIVEDTLIQAKGREYTLTSLLDSGLEAARFRGGSYATIYLSPRDYHRIHCPISGQVTKVSYIPGQLFPVNNFSVQRVDELFAINERLISFIETPAMQRAAVVKVGATCVGKISLSYHPILSNQPFRRRQDIELDASVEVAHGDELGLFNLGSTVIVLIANPDFAFDPQLIDGQMVRLGQRLGGLRA